MTHHTPEQQVAQLKDALEQLRELGQLLAEQFPQKGNCSEDCQRTALSLALNEVQWCINALEPDDLEPDETFAPNISEPGDVRAKLATLTKSVLSALPRHDRSDTLEPGA